MLSICYPFLCLFLRIMKISTIFGYNENVITLNNSETMGRKGKERKEKGQTVHGANGEHTKPTESPRYLDLSFLHGDI